MPEVHFFGELLGPIGFAEELNVFAKWSVNPGTDKWRLVDGDRSGRTWVAERDDQKDFGDWNEPLQMCFASTGLPGWPKMYLEVYSTDAYGRVDLAGYGWCQMPTAPGLHQRDIVIFRPRGSTIDAVSAYFIGGNPRYDHPSVILTPDSRTNHTTVSVGVVRMSVSVITRNFHATVKFQDPKHNPKVQPCSNCLSAEY